MWLCRVVCDYWNIDCSARPSFGPPFFDVYSTPRVVFLFCFFALFVASIQRVLGQRAPSIHLRTMHPTCEASNPAGRVLRHDTPRSEIDNLALFIKSNCNLLCGTNSRVSLNASIMSCVRFHSANSPNPSPSSAQSFIPSLPNHTSPSSPSRSLHHLATRTWDANTTEK